MDVEGLRWRLVDAKDQVLGRLASHLTTILMGKDKPTYCPWKDEGDVVVVINAKHVAFTGKKLDRKVYRWHTGYPGGLKERTLREQLDKDPIEVLRKAVERMLPRNNLRRCRMRKLRLFPEEQHVHLEQRMIPYVMPPRKYQKDTRRSVPTDGFRYVDDASSTPFGHEKLP